MSINDQFAGGEPFAILRCEKIQSTQSPNKTVSFEKNFKIVAQIFLLSFFRGFRREGRSNHDNAASDRPSLSRVRQRIQVPECSLHERIRGQAHRFSRESSRDSAACLSHPHV